MVFKILLLASIYIGTIYGVLLLANIIEKRLKNCEP